MQTPLTPDTPKKKTPVKRTQPKQWSALPLNHSPSLDPESIQTDLDQLRKRLLSLEHAWDQFLEHLSEQEDSMEHITDEDEPN